MPATLLLGRTTREALIPGLIQRIKALKRVPTLAIIQVGDREDSNSYIKMKKAFSQKIGAEVRHIKLSETISQAELIKSIIDLNADESVDGIIVQLPLPASIDRNVVVESIDSKKDADGLTSHATTVPATARGVIELLNYYQIPLKGKTVTVIGRSALVGAPIATLCSNAGAHVIVCHRGTPDLTVETLKADIVIVAAGKPNLIGREHVKSGQVIIDVGINTVKGDKLEDEVEDTKLVGDVDFEAVKDVVKAITPVPGGVGPMTVLALFENLVDLCENRV